MAQINKEALSRIFNNTTASYKFLFFLSLMELLKENNFSNRKFTYQELTSMMLAYAWYPKKYFRLSFGKQDQIGKLIEKIDIPRKLTPINTLYEKILLDRNSSRESILRDVPQRLIREFLIDEMIEEKGSRNEYAINKKIRSLSSITIKSSAPPIYEINKENKTIEIAEIWQNFFKENFYQLYGWTLWNWAAYLQKHNFNTPAIIYKLIPPSTRESLAKQKIMWNELIKSSEIRCIYSNELIKNHYHIDHFLPWSFVAHNQLWNLIPTSPEINLQKNDSIPSDKYIPMLAERHLKLLLALQRVLGVRKWESEANLYLEALNLSQFDDLLNCTRLTDGYIKTYKPLIEIAKNNGFPGKWCLN
jgi:hypothetical protein